MTESHFQQHANRLLRQAKYRSKRKGHGHFDLTYTDVYAMYRQQRGLCKLSGIPMVFGPNATDSPDSLSIDQIKAGVGYSKDNVQLLTRSVNNAKSTLTTENFIAMCQNVTTVAARQSQGNSPACPPHGSSCQGSRSKGHPRARQDCSA